MVPGTYHVSTKTPECIEYAYQKLHYYQIGPNSIRTKLLLDLFILLSNQISVGENIPGSYFEGRVCQDGGILGYSISIRSREQINEADVVDECFDDWHRKMDSVLSNLTDDQLQHYAERLKYMKAAHELRHEVERNWLEILNGDYSIDRYDQEIEMLATINQLEILQFYRNHSGANEKKLTILFEGNPEETEPGTRKEFPNEIICESIEIPDMSAATGNIDDFKYSLEVYSK